MTLSRPPTMRVTFGAAELLPPEDDGLSDPPQAVRPAASAATAAVAVRMRTVFMGWSSFVVERGGAARRGGGRPARDGGGPAGVLQTPAPVEVEFGRQDRRRRSTRVRISSASRASTVEMIMAA